MAMRKEQMQIVVILTMSTSLLVSDGSVPKIAREKCISMRKMVTNLVGHCPMSDGQVSSPAWTGAFS